LLWIICQQICSQFVNKSYSHIYFCVDKFIERNGQDFQQLVATLFSIELLFTSLSTINVPVPDSGALSRDLNVRYPHIKLYDSATRAKELTDS